MTSVEIRMTNQCRNFGADSAAMDHWAIGIQVAGAFLQSYPTLEEAMGHMTSQERSGRRLLFAIMLALAGWGLLLAVGAYLGLWDRAADDGVARDPRRFWVVLGVVGAFLALWGVALAVRARRKR